jgi:hypothetical protein
MRDPTFAYDAYDAYDAYLRRLREGTELEGG